MTTGKKENNSVIALWQRAILNGGIAKLAIEFRKKVGVPVNGFNSPEDFSIWDKQCENNKNEEKIGTSINLYLEESKKIIHYEGILEELSFQILALKFLFNNKIEEEYLDSLKNSGAGVIIVKQGRKFSKHLKESIGEVEDGVYIKIKPFSTISSILKYVEDKKLFIKDSLKVYAENSNLKKPKRMKVSSNFERDRAILLLNSYSKKELEKKFDVKTPYKDQTISFLMRIRGEKEVTQSIVKSVKERRKNK